ncbi:MULTISPECIES: phage tail tape measure protein [unclassified Streptomyces]|uniref:phage tail tape measure protein n=1 Tax=unclassified Streptomyces TaxID=2593676 RepID=UPI003420F819
MASGYNIYVNLMASTGGLSGGLRQGAAQLRAFDGQLAGTGRRLTDVQGAATALGRAQAAASAQMLRSQTQVQQALRRTETAQQRAGRAQNVAAASGRRAASAQAAVTAAGARAARAQVVAQTMAARAAAATGAGAAAAARTATAAQAAAAHAADDHAQAQRRAASAQTSATRAASLAASADARAGAAAQMRDEAEARAARTAQAQARQVARAEADLAAARNARAASLAQAGLVIGAALGVGVANAIALEREMANVMTISQQITGDNVAAFTDQIVRLSTQLPQTAEQLAQGLYQVVSTGFDGAEAMQILQVAAMGASAGLTSSETSARALLGVLKAYGLEASDASDVMDVMFQTVNLGVISFEELAQQLGDVVPMAAAAGVEFDDLSAAFAAITLSGIPAAEAATALNMLMTRLMKPTRELKDAIKDLGYESTASAVEQDGLYVVVNKLNDAAGGTAENLANMWRDIRATRAALALAAADGQNYADTYAGIAREVERAGATQKAYAIQTDTVTGQWSLFRNQVSALGIDMGRALLPALKEIGGALNIFVGAINDLPGPVKSVAGGVLAMAAATLLLRAGLTHVTGQLAAFRTALAATRTGGAVMPTVMAGAGLAVTGLTALLAVGTIAYAAYSASKQKATAATEELVTALKAERDQGETGSGLRKLAEQLTGSDDADKLRKVGVDIEDAIDAVTSGGRKLAQLRKEIQDEGSFAVADPSGSLGSAVSVEAQDAVKVLDKQHKIWSGAVKKEADLASQIDIIAGKIKQSRAGIAGAWSLDQLLPLDKNGAPQYTDEMKALAKAVGDAVDPSRAFKDAQTAAGEAMRKAGKDADDAKVRLSDYMTELRKQAAAQRDFQRNLSELALSRYGSLTDHFGELGVDSAPMLAELVSQLKKGKSEVADELEGIVDEDVRRSTEAYRLGLEQLPAIAAKYGDETARAWARASETNDPSQFKRVTERMALQDLGRAMKQSTASARRELDRGMDLISQVAQKRGKDAANALRDALLSGDTAEIRDQLAATWGADIPIEGPDLSRVAAAFKTAGSQANAEWSAMLELIAAVAKTKGAAAAQALTSALLSGDMAAVKAQLDAIGMSVSAIPGTKSVSVNVTANQPPPVVVPVILMRRPSAADRDGNGIPDMVQAPQAEGSVLDFYANGGVRPKERHVAHIAPAGAWRVFAEESTGGEAFIPLAHNKRIRSRAIAEETVRRLGGKGINWYADGGLSGWSYSASGLTELMSVSSVRSDSMRKVKRGKSEVEVFDLKLFEKNLDKASNKAAWWRKNLSTVAKRAGQDVADALEAMGEDGVELTHKMATGSAKYIKAMTDDLTRLGLVAKATLADFTSQLKGAVKDQTAFEQNLSKLAAMGFLDLAGMLAEQSDKDAETLAAEAVKSNSKAKAANDAAKSAGKTVPEDDLADLVKIIGAVKSSSTGLHAVAEALSMDEDRIIEVASLGRARIQSALGGKAKRFLDDLGKANRGLAYGDGGILTPGIYATSNGIVTFAEPSTQGEAFIPLGSAKRSSATAVLEDVAERFGYRLTESGVSGSTRLVDARPQGGVQVVVIREQPAALVGSMPITVTGQADRKAVDAVGTEVMRRLRAAQRGGRI